MQVNFDVSAITNVKVSIVSHTANMAIVEYDGKRYLVSIGILDWDDKTREHYIHISSLNKRTEIKQGKP